VTPEQALQVAKSLMEILTHAEAYTLDELEQPIRDLAEEMELKLGQVFGVLRIAITDQKVSPPLIESMEILGEEVTLTRLKKAIETIENNI
jgi:glutamyl-tRNA synthetase